MLSFDARGRSFFIGAVMNSTKIQRLLCVAQVVFLPFLLCIFADGRSIIRAQEADNDEMLTWRHLYVLKGSASSPLPFRFTLPAYTGQTHKGTSFSGPGIDKDHGDSRVCVSSLWASGESNTPSLLRLSFSVASSWL